MASELNTTGLNNLQGIVAANRRGLSHGVHAVRGAHPVVLEAAIRQGVRDDSLVLIEATVGIPQ